MQAVGMVAGSPGARRRPSWDVVGNRPSCAVTCSESPQRMHIEVGSDTMKGSGRWYSVVAASLEESRCPQPKRECARITLSMEEKGKVRACWSQAVTPTGLYGQETAWCPLALMLGGEGMNRGLSE